MKCANCGRNNISMNGPSKSWCKYDKLYVCNECILEGKYCPKCNKSTSKTLTIIILLNIIFLIIISILSYPNAEFIKERKWNQMDVQLINDLEKNEYTKIHGKIESDKKVVITIFGERDTKWKTKMNVINFHLKDNSGKILVNMSNWKKIYSGEHNSTSATIPGLTEYRAGDNASIIGKVYLNESGEKELYAEVVATNNFNFKTDGINGSHIIFRWLLIPILILFIFLLIIMNFRIKLHKKALIKYSAELKGSTKYIPEFNSINFIKFMDLDINWIENRYFYRTYKFFKFFKYLTYILTSIFFLYILITLYIYLQNKDVYIISLFTYCCFPFYLMFLIFPCFSYFVIKNKPSHFGISEIGLHAKYISKKPIKDVFYFIRWYDISEIKKKCYSNSCNLKIKKNDGSEELLYNIHIDLSNLIINKFENLKNVDSKQYEIDNISTNNDKKLKKRELQKNNNNTKLSTESNRKSQNNFKITREKIMKCANCGRNIKSISGLCFNWCKNDKIYICKKCLVNINECPKCRKTIIDINHIMIVLIIIISFILILLLGIFYSEFLTEREWNNMEVVEINNLQDEQKTKIFGRIESEDRVLFMTNDLGGEDWVKHVSDFYLIDKSGKIFVNLSDLKLLYPSKQHVYNSSVFVNTQYFNGDEIYIIGRVELKETGEKNFNAEIISIERKNFKPNNIQNEYIFFFISTIILFSIFIFVMNIEFKRKKLHNVNIKNYTKDFIKIEKNVNFANMKIKWFENELLKKNKNILIIFSVFLIFIGFLMLLILFFVVNTSDDFLGLLGFIFILLMLIPSIYFIDMIIKPTHIGFSNYGIHAKYLRKKSPLFAFSFVKWEEIEYLRKKSTKSNRIYTYIYIKKKNGIEERIYNIHEDLVKIILNERKKRYIKDISLSGNGLLKKIHELKNAKINETDNEMKLTKKERKLSQKDIKFKKEILKLDLKARKMELENMTKSEQKIKKDKEDILDDFIKIPCVGNKEAVALFNAGFRSIDELKNAKAYKFVEIKDFTASYVNMLYKDLRKLGLKEEKKLTRKERKLRQKDIKLKHSILKLELKARKMESVDLKKNHKKILKENILNEFKKIPCVGDKEAKALYNSGFKSIDELKKVKGLKFLEIQGFTAAYAIKLYDELKNMEKK